MNYKNALCFILIGLIVLFSGCTQKKGTNEQDNHDYQNDVTFETATETAKPRSYVKQGFFSVSEIQANEMINAVINSKDLWSEGLEDNQIYFMEFADLNFDGQIEFIVCDTLFDDKASFHANAYYLNNGQLKKANIIEDINPMNGYDNYYTAYFDKTSGQYVVIGHNYTQPDEQHYEDLVYQLLFDGQTITIEHLLNKTTYSTDKQSESDNQYTYYRFENEAATEIPEKDYKEALSELEENDNWVEIIKSPVEDRNVKYDDWKSASSSDKEQLLFDALSTLSYDIYVSDGE